MTDEWPQGVMRVGAWFDQYGQLVLLSVDLLLFVAAVALWKPGTRTLASALFVVALIPPLAVLGVIVDPIED